MAKAIRKPNWRFLCKNLPKNPLHFPTPYATIIYVVIKEMVLCWRLPDVSGKNI
jgi:hypothetical protein